MAQRFILASASKARLALLTGAGISCGVVPAHVDEAAIKRALVAQNTATSAIAAALADAKALKISRQHSSALVLGGDQILVCEGQLYDKPADMEEAAAHLRSLSGRWHALETAVVLAENGEIIWRHSSTARLKMRLLSDAFIKDYLAQIGSMALSSVGAYQLEGLGAQLFGDIDGDFFTILGLPLLPVLQQLRQRAMLPQ